MRFVFLSYLSEVDLEASGRAGVHELYALTRFSSRSPNPLRDFSISRKSTRRIANLKCGKGKERLETIEEVELSLLVENKEVAAAIDRLFHVPGHAEMASRHSRGLGSVFDRAYRCASAFVEPAPTVSRPGSVEIETTIFCHYEIDLKLHSIFRVNDNRTI